MSVIREFEGHKFETATAKPAVELQRILVVHRAMLTSGKFKVFISDLTASVQTALWPDGISRNSAYNALVNALRDGALIDGEWLISIESKPKETKKLYEKTKYVWLRRGRFAEIKASAPSGDPALRAAAESIAVTVPGGHEQSCGPSRLELAEGLDVLEALIGQITPRVAAVEGGLDHFDKRFEEMATRLKALEDRV